MSIPFRDARGRIVAVREARKLDGVCAVCGASFRYDPCERKGRVCSLQCSGALVGKRGEYRRRNPKAKKVCPYCNKEFETYHRNRRFCSRPCSDRGQPSKLGGRKDANHDAIVACFCSKGFLVYDTHLKGHGYPDLTVQKDGITYLVEIKNPKWIRQRRLSPLQEEFAREFQIYVVCTEADVDGFSAMQQEHKRAVSA